MIRGDRWLYGWAFGYAAVGGASVLVPLYAIELGAGAFVVGLVAATAAFAGVPGALLWGRLAAGTRRRRPFVLVTLGATAATLALVPLLASPWTVLVANAVLWFVVAAAAPVLNLIAIEGVPESRWGRRLGLLNAYQGYGWVGGLAVGTAWTAVAPRLPGGDPGLRPLFPLLAGVAALGLALVRVWYPERPTTDPARFRRAFRRMSGGPGAGRYLRSVPYGLGRVYWAVVSARRGPGAYRSRFDRELRRYLFASTLFATGFAVFWGPMPAFLRAVPFDTGTVFGLFLVANLGSAVCYGPVGDRAGEGSADRLQRGALGARALLFAAVPAVVILPRRVSLWSLGVVFALVGATWAVLAVTTPGLVGGLADPDVRAEALGVQAALAGVGTGIGSVAGGAAAAAVGYGPTFVAAGGLVLAGGTLAFRVG